MIGDAFVIRLPDGTFHYARPGHVDALCGADRVTNLDRWTGTVDAICSACSLLRGKPEPSRGIVAREVECPDCGALWPILSGEPCPGCGLLEEDVEAAADFWVALGTGEL